MHACTGLLIVLAALGRFWVADPWIGMWQVVSAHYMADPAQQATLTFQPNGIQFVSNFDMDGMAGSGSRETWTAQFDEHDYMVSFTPPPAKPPYKLVTAKRLDQGCLEVTYKDGQAVVYAQRLTTSGENQEMILTRKNQNTGDWFLTGVWDRTGGELDHSNPLAGIWTKNYDKGSLRNPIPPLTIVPAGDDGVHFRASPYSSFIAEFNGKNNPVRFGWWETVALRRVDAHTLEIIGKGAKAASETYRLTVSEDGDKMTWTSESLQPSGAHFNFERVLHKKQ